MLGLHEAQRAGADQVLPSGGLEGLDDRLPVSRFTVLKEGPLHLPLSSVPGDVHLFTGEGVDTNAFTGYAMRLKMGNGGINIVDAKRQMA